jgi:hypothetical protein
MVRIIDNEFLHTCPLTGLKLEGRGLFKKTNSPPDVLYIFPAIGSALLDMGLLIEFDNNEESGNLRPRADLAGVCRAAHERKQKPFNISDNYYSGPDPTWPKSFEEKQAHFLQLLYDSGGNERKPRTIQTLEDFPLAFANDAEQFHRIIESLLDENLIRYNDNWVVQGDLQGDIQTTYHNVLLTSTGKHTLSKLAAKPTNMPYNNFNFGNGAKVHFIQGDGAVQNNITGDKAAINVATGNQNTQTNQSGQPVSLPDLVVKLKYELAGNAFDSCREEIEHELGHVEIQLKKPEPKKLFLERSFDYLKELAIRSAGPAAASAVVELVKHAPALLAATGL